MNHLHYPDRTWSKFYLRKLILTETIFLSDVDSSYLNHNYKKPTQ